MDLETNKSENLFLSLAEKKDLAKKICKTYSLGKYTIESVCLKHGVPVRTFRQWVGDIAEVADLYKKAKSGKREERKGDLLRLAETALEKRLEGWPTEETIINGSIGPDGEMQKKSMRRSKRIVPPDSTLIIYALKISNPKKYHELYIDQPEDEQETLYDYTKLTDNELESLTTILDKLSKSDA